MMRGDEVGKEGAELHALLPSSLHHGHPVRRGAASALGPRSEADLPHLYRGSQVSLGLVVLGGESGILQEGE